MGSKCETKKLESNQYFPVLVKTWCRRPNLIDVISWLCTAGLVQLVRVKESMFVSFQLAVQLKRTDPLSAVPSLSRWKAVREKYRRLSNKKILISDEESLSALKSITFIRSLREAGRFPAKFWWGREGGEHDSSGAL